MVAADRHTGKFTIGYQSLIRARSPISALDEVVQSGLGFGLLDYV